ncbi:MAG: WYL domain-containing protein [Spirochaetales bacterium]|nr:WYL domain-containing protein [Spirochaetales bacterium]
MSNLHRIQWIDDQRRRGSFPNCSDIARKFEITVRQASRDIEYLRFSLGAPVEYDHQHRGYEYIGDDFILPRERLSSQDAGLLQELTQSYRQIGTRRTAKIAELFSRIYQPETTEPLHVSETRILSVRSIIETCMQEKKQIFIEYIDAGNTRTERTVKPLRLFQWGEHEHLEAWCSTRNATRQFRLDRVLKARPALQEPGSSPVEQENESTLTKEIIYIGGSESAIGREPYTACIHTGSRAQDAITCRFHDSLALLGWLTSRYERFEIVSPRWLREKAGKMYNTLSIIHRAL